MAAAAATTDSSGSGGGSGCHIAELDLSDNAAGVTASETLAEAIAQMPLLEQLKYTGNKPALEGLTKLAAALATRNGLQVCGPTCWRLTSC